MKKLVFNFAIIAFVAAIFFITNAQRSTEEKSNKEDVVIEEDTKKIIGVEPMRIDPDHKFQSIDCKSCHSCDYPTAADPCLTMCPRDKEISIYHAPEEGPELVLMDEVKGNYGPVMFSHKIHAQMSVMSGGCETCHHYNTTGPVLKCGACHEDRHMRDDISIPDLEAAYHRQCLDCHMEWSRSFDCNFCHVSDGQDIEKLRLEKLAKYTGLDHPEMNQPQQVVYETNYPDGKLVTFYHNEHVNIFNQDCNSCHQNESCMKCHDVSLTNARGKLLDEQRKKASKTFDEHHAACASCHEVDQNNTNNCIKCHTNEVQKPFDHKISTGFDLSKYHAKVSCNSCHKNNEFKGLRSSCKSCHNFNSDNFDHKITGFQIDDMHSFLDCGDCHKGANYNKPVCDDCHDGYTYPDLMPGEKIK